MYTFKDGDFVRPLRKTIGQIDWRAVAFIKSWGRELAH